MGLLRTLFARRGRRLAGALPGWGPEGKGRQTGHVVHFYAGPFPTETVGRFVQEGLGAGEIAILIATPEHVAAVERRLGDQKDRVLSLDADETLARFMVAGHPDRLRFMDTVGDLVAQAAQHGNGQVRAYGEMVVRLCERGEPEAAHELELLWNELGGRHDLKLLCAYPVRSMGGLNRPFHARLRDAHSHAVA